MNKEPNEINAITMPLADFQALSPEEREVKRQEAIGLVKSLIRTFLVERKYYWILICGTVEAIRAGADNVAGVKSAKEIAEFEQRMGHPAYSIYRHEVVQE